MVGSRASTISISIMLMLSRAGALLEEDCLQVTTPQTKLINNIYQIS